ncbi:Hypothetical predicted protein, partial [Cloeon dipterum]
LLPHICCNSCGAATCIIKIKVSETTPCKEVFLSNLPGLSEIRNLSSLLEDHQSANITKPNHLRC